jgi:hypothetical protein
MILLHHERSYCGNLIVLVELWNMIIGWLIDAMMVRLMVVSSPSSRVSVPSSSSSRGITMSSFRTLFDSFIVLQLVVVVVLSLIVANMNDDMMVSAVTVTNSNQLLLDLPIWSRFIPANVTKQPSPRYDFASTMDTFTNSIYLYGGVADDGMTSLGELWKLTTISTMAWTCVHYAAPGASAVYGIRGSENEGSGPGSRHGASLLSLPNGYLWLFGGATYVSKTTSMDVTVTVEDHNDLWQWRPTPKRWVWLRGSNIAGVNGSYGIFRQLSIDNEPPSRSHAALTIDSSGRIFLTGGFSQSLNRPLDDVWCFYLAWVIPPSLLFVMPRYRAAHAYVCCN